MWKSLILLLLAAGPMAIFIPVDAQNPGSGPNGA